MFQRQLGDNLCRQLTPSLSRAIDDRRDFGFADGLFVGDELVQEDVEFGVAFDFIENSEWTAEPALDAVWATLASGAFGTGGFLRVFAIDEREGEQSHGVYWAAFL